MCFNRQEQPTCAQNRLLSCSVVFSVMVIRLISSQVIYKAHTCTGFMWPLDEQHTAMYRCRGYTCSRTQNAACAKIHVFCTPEVFENRGHKAFSQDAFEIVTLPLQQPVIQ